MYTKCINLPTTKNTLPFAEVQVIIADSEDNLQRGVFTLLNKAKNFGVEKLPEKYEAKAFLGEDTVRCKIIVDYKSLQKVQNFEYLGCEISYESKKKVFDRNSKICSNTENSEQHF
jgi:hypothetical protein